jgi:endo-1,4-beta-xylanase
MSFASDSLKDAFQGKFKIGTSVSPHELGSGENFIKKHFNSITPENELKPDAIINQQACQQNGRNVETQVAFNQGTRSTLSFCERNRIPLRGHTFVWYSQTPDWFFRENFGGGNYVSKDVMDQRLESFIKNTFSLELSLY